MNYRTCALKRERKTWRLDGDRRPVGCCMAHSPRGHDARAPGWAGATVTAKAADSAGPGRPGIGAPL